MQHPQRIDESLSDFRINAIRQVNMFWEGNKPTYLIEETYTKTDPQEGRRILQRDFTKVSESIASHVSFGGLAETLREWTEGLNTKPRTTQSLRHKPFEPIPLNFFKRLLEQSKQDTTLDAEIVVDTILNEYQ